MHVFICEIHRKIVSRLLTFRPEPRRIIQYIRRYETKVHGKSYSVLVVPDLRLTEIVRELLSAIRDFLIVAYVLDNTALKTTIEPSGTLMRNDLSPGRI